ncbi:MAG: DUF5054 domain-containing protein, partial [Anaerolineaceae bacterium]|nr:DUF5054 domain-containing protein [Anaerolineaceae bacterium]
EQSWLEQRNYLRAAMDCLSGELHQEAENRLAALVPKKPDQQNYEPISDFQRPLKLGRFLVTIDQQFGCLTRLEIEGKSLAGPNHPLGKFWYETFSAADYGRFHRQYNVNKRETWFWAIPDFTKPGIENAGNEHKLFLPHQTWAGLRRDGDADRLLLLFDMPQESWQVYGAPKKLSLGISGCQQSAELKFLLQWFDKPASRLPEAIWFSFEPKVKQPREWKMDKLGQWISPYEVIRNGNRHLHAVGDNGLALDNESEKLSIQSADAALVAPGQPSLLDFNNRQPNLSKGIHFNLYNNLWGTNFPMWYEEDALFRFTLKV